MCRLKVGHVSGFDRSPSNSAMLSMMSCDRTDAVSVSANSSISLSMAFRIVKSPTPYAPARTADSEIPAIACPRSPSSEKTRRASRRAFLRKSSMPSAVLKSAASMTPLSFLPRTIPSSPPKSSNPSSISLASVAVSTAPPAAGASAADSSGVSCSDILGIVPLVRSTPASA